MFAASTSHPHLPIKREREQEVRDQGVRTPVEGFGVESVWGDGCVHVRAHVYESAPVSAGSSL